MGYYVDSLDCDWVVPERPDILEELKKMPAKMKRIQKGGSFGEGVKQESWFSWVSDNEILDATTVESVVRAFGFETKAVDGGFSIVTYNMDKIGQEELLLAVLAPYCPEGSYIVWRGEDGEMWSHIVSGGKMKIRYLKPMEWQEPEEYLYRHYGTVIEDDKWNGYSADIDVYQDIDAQIEQAESLVREVKVGE